MKIQTKNILWGIVFLMIGVAWIFGLFIDITGDSGLYAAISRQMVESGDWLNLKINGKPYDQKPHLLFWLAGLGIKLFGNNNFAFKLFPFLFAISSLWFVYKLGRLLFSREAGLTAALIAGTSQMFFLYLLDIHADTILQAGVSLALWQLIAYFGKKNKFNFIFGFIGIGLAMLAKGPVGAVLPFFTVLIYLLIQKDYRQLFHPKWIAGIVIVILVISPTLYHLFDSFGWEGLRFYFITNNMGRVTGEYAGSSTEPFFYLYNMLWAFLPWTIFVVVAVFWEIKSWFSSASRNTALAALLGSVLVLLFVYSISKGKAPHYFLILVPPLALVTAGYLTTFKKLAVEGRRILCAQGAVLTIMFLVFIAVVFFFSENISRLPVLLLALLFVSAWLFTQKEKESWQRLIFFSIMISGIFNIFLNAEFIPGLFRYQGARQALKVFEQNRKPEDKLYNFALVEYELFFMADEKVEDIKVPKRLYKLLELGETWVYTNKIKYNDIIKMEEKIDTVYVIPQRGMNQLNLQFFNPEKREKSLVPNYLIKGKQN